MTPLRGIFLPAFDELADARVLAGLAAAAERAGWDGIFLWDHVQYAEPVGPIADPWTCLAAIALATTTIRLGALVTPLARRRPWVLARQAVTLDRLSGGRLVLGFGVGGGGVEWAEFGEATEPRTRADLLDEGLELLEELLSGRPVAHAGPHYDVRARPFLPLPVQRPRIPVWIGGRWPNGGPIRRAARWDGFFPIGLGPEDVPELRRRVDEAREQHEAPFELVARVAPGDPLAPWLEADLTWLLTDLGPSPLPGGGYAPTVGLAEARAIIAAR